jgi:hypothetical protein
MDLTTRNPVSAAAPGRCDDRTARLARVKFVALVMEDTAPAAESLSCRSARLYLAVRAFLIRVMGRLVAARP